MSKRPYAAIALAVASTCVGSVASGQVITWSNAAGGSWQTPANWAGGVVPTNVNTARFATTAVYTVTTTSNINLTGWTIEGLGTPTFRSAAAPTKIVTATNVTIQDEVTARFDTLFASIPGTLTVSDDSSLILQNGAVVNTSNLALGTSGNASSIGIIFVQAASGLTVTGNTATHFLGRSGRVGRLDVSAGGSVNIGGTLALGDSASAGSQGLVNVQGAGTIASIESLRIGTGTATPTQGIFTATGGTTTVGGASTGTMVIGTAAAGVGLLDLAGAATVFNGPIVQTTVNPTGTIKLLGATYNVRGPTTFAGGTLQVEPTGTGGFLFAAGTLAAPLTVTANNSANLDIDGILAFKDRNRLDLTGNASLDLSSGDLRIINDDVRVTANNASITAGRLDVRPATGSAGVIVTSTGSATFSSEVRLGSTNVIGTGTAELSIEKSSTATFGDVFMSNVATTGYTSNLTITGGGTVATQLANKNTLIGSTTTLGGLATLTVSSAATFHTATGSGSTLVEKNGRVNVTNSGTININHDWSLRPGAQLTSDASSSINIAPGADVEVFNSLVSVGGVLALEGGSDLFATTDVLFNVGGVTLGKNLPGSPTFTVNGSDTLASVGSVGIANGNAASAPALIVHGRGQLNVSGALDVGTGTSFNGVGTAVVDDGALLRVAGTGSVTVGGVGIGNATGLIDVKQGGTFFAFPSVNFRPRGTLRIDDASATIGGVINSGGKIDFRSGTLTVNNNLLTGINQPLPSLFSVTPDHTLIVAQQLSMAADSFLKLDGGRIKTGTLVGPGQLLWSTGTLELDLTGTAIGPGQPLGQLLVLDAGKTLRLNGEVHVQQTGVLELRGGTLSGPTFGDLRNDGTVLFDVSGTVPFTGIIHNNASGIVLIGDRASISIASSFNNAGRIDLQGGIARLNGPSAITNTGVITGDGQIALPINNSAAGIVRADDGDTLRFSSPLNNAGRIELSGGRVETTAALVNAAAGTITGRGAIVAPTISNGGALALSGDATDVYGDFANTATGRVTVSGNARATFYDDFDNAAGASLRVSAGSSATFFGTFAGGGATGTGDVFLEADITPGFSPAAVSFGGNLSLGPAARLVMEIGGLSAGAKYDQVSVAGLASLDGQMDVVAIDGFRILPGDQFTLLTFGTRTGTLAVNFVGNTLAGLGLEATYDAHALIVRGTGLDGDADLDGTVNFDDLLALAQNYGAAGTVWATGDFDRSGTTNFDDLLALAQNYGKSIDTDVEDGGAAAAAFAADWALAQSLAPEPATAILLLPLALASRRRRG